MKLSLGKGSVWFPFDDEMRALCSKHQVGDVVDVEIRHERSQKLEGYIAVVITKLAAMLGVTFDEMRAELLIETNRAQVIHTRTEEYALALPSMSRASWTHKDLSRFWDDARRYILDKVMVSLDVPDQDAIRELLGEPHGQSGEA